MPFSHHSHSGQFCPGHARDSLEDVVRAAIDKGMQVLALTEHMPRHDEDRYPEEIEAGVTFDSQLANEAAYVTEATRLRAKYGGQISLPIGFECDWIRAESVDLIKRSLETYPYDVIVGSVHHVHTIPIDYDRPMYEQARERSGGTDEKLYQDYYDDQLAMLQALRPPIVGHFDLIRLKSDHPNGGSKAMPGVWQRILRNLDFVAAYGGIIEVNAAGLRKGLNEPYPAKEICQAALDRSIRFCLSDDSHGVDQVALNYERILPFLREVGVQSVVFAEHAVQEGPLFDGRFPALRIREIGFNHLHDHAFWKTTKAPLQQPM